MFSKLKNVEAVNVDPESGKKIPFWNPLQEKTEIQTGLLNLPKGQVEYLGIDSERVAQSLVIGKKEVLQGDLTNTPVFVFAHGFSQRPLNYFSLLAYLAVQGYVVIAPRVWVLSVLFQKVETIDVFDGLQAKLQTALLIDTARSAQIAFEYSSKVHVLGHSMGGAMSMVYAGYASAALQSVAVLAPEVGAVKLTDLNQTVRLDDCDGEDRMRNLASMMACRMLMLHGARDKIVQSEDMETVLNAFANAPLTGLVSMLRGTHIGFEDTLEVDLPFTDIEEFFFGLLDRLLFGEFFDPFKLDTKEQLESTKDFLLTWINNIEADDEELRTAIEQVIVPSESEISWN